MKELYKIFGEDEIEEMKEDEEINSQTEEEKYEKQRKGNRNTN